MLQLSSEQQDRLAEVCRRNRVRRLALFGSATRPGFNSDTSDVDVIAEFDAMLPSEHADRYFALIVDLEGLFGRPVDLIESQPITNPYFRESVEASKVVLFEAA